MLKSIKPFVCRRILPIAIAVGMLISGCSTSTQRIDPGFRTYRQPMGTMLVLTPEVTILEQLPDGGRLFQTDQSLAARQIALRSIIEQLGQRRFTVKTADADTMKQPEIKNIISLFRSVNRSIQLHTFGPQIFPAKLKLFEYGLGSIADTLKNSGADGLVLAIGYQSGADRPARNWLSIAVVEPGGKIIWYSVQGDHQKYDLLNSASLTALVTDTMVGFWESGT